MPLGIPVESRRKKERLLKQQNEGLMSPTTVNQTNQMSSPSVLNDKQAEERKLAEIKEEEKKKQELAQNAKDL